MKTLIVEDDFLARSLLSTLLCGFGTCDVAVNGAEAVKAVRTAIEEGTSYDLICLDIMMPVMDGHETLREIRRIEAQQRVESGEQARIIMVTALGDEQNILQAYRSGNCDAYLTKPVDREQLLGHLREMRLVS